MINLLYIFETTRGRSSKACNILIYSDLSGRTKVEHEERERSGKKVNNFR